MEGPRIGGGLPSEKRLDHCQKTRQARGVLLVYLSICTLLPGAIFAGWYRYDRYFAKSRLLVVVLSTLRGRTTNFFQLAPRIFVPNKYSVFGKHFQRAKDFPFSGPLRRIDRRSLDDITRAPRAAYHRTASRRNSERNDDMISAHGCGVDARGGKLFCTVVL